MYEYAARLVRVIDADTVVLDLDLGLSVWAHGRRIRLLGVDAPELRTEAGLTARVWAEAWFATHCPDDTLTVRTVKDKADSFGRYLGVVTAPDGSVLNEELLTAGQAVMYAPR